MAEILYGVDVWNGRLHILPAAQTPVHALSEDAGL